MAIPTPESYARVRTMTYAFAKACERSYILHLDLSKAIAAFPQVEYSEELESLKDRHQDTGLQTIVFAAMCLEAAIFDYAAVHLGDAYVRDHLDKLDLLSKWVVIMRFVSDHQYPKGAEPYNSLKQLVAARNSLVHSKSEALSFTDVESQLKRIRAESEQLDRDIHTAFRTLVLISIDYELHRGRLGNPLPSFLRLEEYGETPVPNAIKGVVSSCRTVIERKIDAEKSASSSF